jgi:hypothetical protein
MYSSGYCGLTTGEVAGACPLPLRLTGLTALCGLCSLCGLCGLCGLYGLFGLCGLCDGEVYPLPGRESLCHLLRGRRIVRGEGHEAALLHARGDCREQAQRRSAHGAEDALFCAFLFVFLALFCPARLSHWLAWAPFAYPWAMQTSGAGAKKWILLLVKSIHRHKKRTGDHLIMSQKSARRQNGSFG